MNKGTIFDLEERQGDWFDFFESRIDQKTGEVIYDDPIPGSGKVCFRDMREFWQERLAKRKKRHEFVVNPTTKAMERVEYYEVMTAEEEQKERDDAFDYSIIDLKDFYDAKKKPIECTRENKLKLVTLPVFDRFMARCIILQQEAKGKQIEASEKNSSTP